MRVLVLGAGGFVGRAVTAALSASGWATPLAGLRRATGGGERTGIVLDVRDQGALAAALDGVDAVVNCVAGRGDVIAGGARVLAEAGGGRRIVHLSSMAVYGDAVDVATEDTAFGTDLGTYGEAKVAAERVIAATGNAVILRPGCIYGAGSPQWTDRIARLLIQRRIGELGVGGDGASNLVHRRDVVAAILAALRLPGDGVRIFNLAQPDAPDWNGYFISFARAIGAVPVRHVPGWELTLEARLLAPPLELIRRGLRGGGRFDPIPPSLTRLWRDAVRLDSSRAQDELGLEWLPLAEGLTEAAVAWRGKA